jgi:aldehyde dehydrogenase
MLDAAIAPLQGSSVTGFAFKARCDNFINGKFAAPVSGQYFDNVSPITGQVFTQAARSNEADINLALDAAHAASDGWGKTSPAARALILNKIADRLEANLDLLAYVATVDNGKPIRETTFADIPLADGRRWVPNYPMGFISSRRCSKVITGCGCSRRRFLGRCSR